MFSSVRFRSPEMMVLINSVATPIRTTPVPDVPVPLTERTSMPPNMVTATMDANLMYCESYITLKSVAPTINTNRNELNDTCQRLFSGMSAVGYDVI